MDIMSYPIVDDYREPILPPTSTSTSSSSELSGVSPTLWDRITRVSKRLDLSFGLSLAIESKVQSGRLGINLFKCVSVYPVLILHLVPRKEPLEGAHAERAERVFDATDKAGNYAFVATLAAAVAGFVLNLFSAIAASEALLGIAGIFFTATVLFKATAFCATLAADFCNQSPVLKGQ